MAGQHPQAEPVGLKPWAVPIARVPLVEAVDFLLSPLARGAHDIELGPSIRWLSAIATYARSLAAGRRIAPVTVTAPSDESRRGPVLQARWLPAPAGPEDLDWLARAASAMPEVLRIALPEGGAEFRGEEPQWDRTGFEPRDGAFDAILVATTDAVIRRALVGWLVPWDCVERVKDEDPLATCWALVREDGAGIGGSLQELPAFGRRMASWNDRVAAEGVVGLVAARRQDCPVDRRTPLAAEPGDFWGAGRPAPVTPGAPPPASLLDRLIGISPLTGSIRGREWLAATYEEVARTAPLLGTPSSPHGPRPRSQAYLDRWYPLADPSRAKDAIGLARSQIRDARRYLAGGYEIGRAASKLSTAADYLIEAWLVKERHRPVWGASYRSMQAHFIKVAPQELRDRITALLSDCAHVHADLGPRDEFEDRFSAEKVQEIAGRAMQRATALVEEFDLAADTGNG